MDKPVLWMVIPCYNEEEVLPETARRLKTELAGLVEKELISPDSRIAFIDDGSRDATWSLVRELYENDFVFPVSSCLATEVTRTRFWRGL